MTGWLVLAKPRLSSLSVQRYPPAVIASAQREAIQ
jgi:hypothetical protein